MNKKICLIIVISFLVGIIISGSVFLILTKNNNDRISNNNEVDNSKVDNDLETNNDDDYEKLANGYYEIAKDVYTYIKEDGNNLIDIMDDSVIYNANKNYAKSKLEDLDFLDNLTLENSFAIDEYLKYFFWIFKEESKTSFSEEDMSVVLSFAANMLENPRDSEYMKNLAKRYFNVDNFEMITGTYTTLFSKYQLEKYSIMKTNDYYVLGGLKPGEIDLKYDAYMTDIKVNGNKVTIYYDYATGAVINAGCYSEELSQQEKEECRVGTYQVEITMDKDKQIFAVNKLTYFKEK